MCGEGLDDFHTSYVAIHGWASLMVCCFGSVANLLNVIVLTRKEMKSPTNAILTGLAVADMLVMFEYIPYAFHAYLYHRPKRDKYTYAWSFFVLFHSGYAQIFHTISIWLTVTLAIWRYIAVAYPQRNRDWCTYRRTMWAIGTAYVICPLICIPVYLQTEVRGYKVTLDSEDRELNSTNYNATLYYVKMTEAAQSDTFEHLNFWIYSVFIKLIPCCALTVLSLRLIVALLEAKKRRRKLAQISQIQMEESTSNQARKNSKVLDKEKQTDRTTRMLVAVLLLFLLTEFPQGIMGLLKVIHGEEFFNTCYTKLGKDFSFIYFFSSRNCQERDF